MSWSCEKCRGLGMFLSKDCRKRRMSSTGPEIILVEGMVFCDCQTGKSKLEWVRNEMGKKRKPTSERF